MGTSQIQSFIRDELISLESSISASNGNEVEEVLVEYLESVLRDGEVEKEGEFADISDMITAYQPSLHHIPSEELEGWVCGMFQKVRRLVYSHRKLSASSSLDSTSSSLPSDLFSLQRTLSESSDSSKPDTIGESSVDSSLKKSLVDKHALVEESIQGTYRPTAPPKPTQQPSKVRYFNGQVVSLKGEKFLEKKKDEGEEMKKTYINLKPARKYRFHK